MQPQPISAIDVSLSGEVKSSDIAWLDLGEDIVAVLKDIQNTRTVVGFEWTGERFGVILA